MPDRIATVTYMAAAAVTGGNVTLRLDVDNTHPFCGHAGPDV